MTKTENKITFPSQSFAQRLSSMLRVDIRRMFTTSRFYVMCGIALAVPILILVMTTMVGSAEVTDPNTGAESSLSFTNTWQIIGTVMDMDMMSGSSGAAAEAASADSAAAMSMGMDMTSMMNINLIYFAAGVLVCLFVADDFRSGYAKNLFTVRAKKGDYVVSKIIVCTIASAIMLMSFFVGGMLGGAFAGLPFDIEGASTANLVMCISAKLFLLPLFVSIFLSASVFAKRKVWLSIILSMFVGMLLFMMIPMMTPLNSGVMNVGLCLAGGVLFSIGIGAVSNVILRKTNLV